MKYSISILLSSSKIRRGNPSFLYESSYRHTFLVSNLKCKSPGRRDRRERMKLLHAWECKLKIRIFFSNIRAFRINMVFSLNWNIKVFGDTPTNSSLSSMLFFDS